MGYRAKFSVLLLMVLVLACNRSAKTSDTRDTDSTATADATDSAQDEGWINGEGEPVPSALGPLQKPKEHCEAPRQRWPGPDSSLDDLRNVLPPWARSLKVLQTAWVHRQPDKQSLRTGKIKQYSRLPLTKYAPPGGGCSGFWVNLGAEHFVCSDVLKPDRRPPLMRRQPIVPRGRLVPGKYGRIRRTGAPFYPNLTAMEEDKPAGTYHRGDMIRLLKHKTFQGKLLWVTGKKYLVWDSDVHGYRIPRYHGADLRKLDLNLPVGIIRAKTKGATVYEYPGGPPKKNVKPLRHYSIHAIYDRKRVGKTLYYRVKEGWILARRVLSAWPAKFLPPGLGKCEKWIEVNISMQTLVAYEGREPVYVAPISSGKKNHPTKYGIFRIWLKRAYGDMTSGMGGGEHYHVSDVPWTMFFYMGQSLHAAYWHTDFGTRKSHGCINLTPIDARWLYEWTEPPVPPGFLEVRVDEKSPIPGTIVVVRHKYDHEVPFYKYARKLAPKDEVKRLDDLRKQRLYRQYLNSLKNRR